MSYMKSFLFVEIWRTVLTGFYHFLLQYSVGKETSKMIEEQTKSHTYLEQIEKLGELNDIVPHITAVSTLLSEKNIVTEEKFYKEIIKFIKEKRETGASEETGAIFYV